MSITTEPTAPAYWPEATEQLCQNDPVMGRLVQRSRSGGSLQRRGDAFTTLARAVVGQQISVKAAATIWARLTAAVDPWVADQVYARGASGLAGLGLSERKISYLIDLAAHFTQAPDLSSVLLQAADDEVILRLTEIRGIGRWTAEMFLIFNLQRPDILPVGDLGLRKAISLHYLEGQPVTADQAQRLGEQWRPWRSVATWYLWRSLDPISVDD